MDLIQQLRRDEGVRYRAYPDSKGNMTTGVGHLILPSEPWLLSATLTDDQVNVLLAHDIAEDERELAPIAWYWALDACRQGAIVNMCFNLGLPHLLGFPSMIHYLSIGWWEQAASEALDSNWAKPPPIGVGDRATRLAEQLRTGEWQ